MANPSFNLVPGNLSLNGVVGNDFSVLFDFDIDLTGYTFQAQVILQNIPNNNYGTFLITNTNLEEGRITLSLTDTQTKNIGAITNTKWYLSWTVGGNTRTVLSGNFSLNNPWSVTNYSPTSESQTVHIDETTVEVTVIGGAGGSVVWGDIQGDIEDQTDLIQYLQDNYSTISQNEVSQGFRVVSVFEGDSLTSAEGETGPDGCWPFQMINSWPLFKKSEYENVAEPGNTAQQIVVQYPSQVAPFFQKKPTDLNYFFLWAGTNDIGAGRSAEQIYLDLSQEWSLARNDGFIVVAFLVASRSDYTVVNGYETVRLELNSLIQSDDSLYDYLIDVGNFVTEPTPGGAWGDTTDGIHFSYSANFLIGLGVRSTLSNNSLSLQSIGENPNGVSYGSIGSIISSYVTGELFVKSTGTGNSGWSKIATIPISYTSGLGEIFSILTTNSSNSYMVLDSNQTSANLGIVLKRNSVNKWLVHMESSSDDFIVTDSFSSGVSIRNNAGTMEFTPYNHVVPSRLGTISRPWGTINVATVVATSTIQGSNLSGTNTGDQYGGVTTSTANQYLRRNAANSGYEFGNKTDYLNTTPTTGQTVSFNDNPTDQLMRINPAGDLPALTVDLPSNATSQNTQKVIFMCTNNIVLLTITGASTIFNAPVSMNAGDCFQFYKTGSDEWARVIT